MYHALAAFEGSRLAAPVALERFQARVPRPYSRIKVAIFDVVSSELCCRLSAVKKLTSFVDSVCALFFSQSILAWAGSRPHANKLAKRQLGGRDETLRSL